MFSTSESWLAIGAIVIIACIVVGLSTCMGKLIISVFGTGQEGGETSGRNKRAMKLHEAA
jgi:hypothetical protein